MNERDFLGYFIGQVQLNMTARSLNVTVADLDVSSSDRVLLAVASALVGATITGLVFAGCRLIFTGTPASQIGGVALVGTGIGLVSYLSQSGPSGEGPATGVFISILVLPLIALTLAANRLRPLPDGRPRSAPNSAAALIGTIVCVMFFSGEFSGTWARADDLSKVAAATELVDRRLPAFVGLVISPREGLITFDGSSHCGVRITPRVAVIGNRVQVNPEPFRFAPSKCLKRN